MKVYKVETSDGGSMIFRCVQKNTRTGFAHESGANVFHPLFNSIACPTVKQNYLNRTWGMYEFQTTMISMVKIMKNAVLGGAEAQYRLAMGYKRMTAARREHFMNDFLPHTDAGDKIKFLDEVLEQLRADKPQEILG